MKRVDEHHRALERQPGGGGEVAKTLDEGGFPSSLEPRLGEPGRKLGNLGFCHGADHSGARRLSQRGPALAPILGAP